MTQIQQEIQAKCREMCSDEMVVELSHDVSREAIKTVGAMSFKLGRAFGLSDEQTCQLMKLSAFQVLAAFDHADKQQHGVTQ